MELGEDFSDSLSSNTSYILLARLSGGQTLPKVYFFSQKLHIRIRASALFGKARIPYFGLDVLCSEFTTFTFIWLIFIRGGELSVRNCRRKFKSEKFYHSKRETQSLKYIWKWKRVSFISLALVCIFLSSDWLTIQFCFYLFICGFVDQP